MTRLLAATPSFSSSISGKSSWISGYRPCNHLRLQRQQVWSYPAFSLYIMIRADGEIWGRNLFPPAKNAIAGKALWISFGYSSLRRQVAGLNNVDLLLLFFHIFFEQAFGSISLTCLLCCCPGALLAENLDLGFGFTELGLTLAEILDAIGIKREHIVQVGVSYRITFPRSFPTFLKVVQS